MIVNQLFSFAVYRAFATLLWVDARAEQDFTALLASSWLVAAAWTRHAMAMVAA